MDISASDRELSNTMSGALIARVRRRSGEETVRRILEVAADPRPLEDIEDQGQWTSYARTRRLFQAAVEVTGEADLPRQTGAEVLSLYAGSEVVNLLRGLGTPGAVMRVSAELAGKQTTISSLTCLETTERSAVVASSIQARFEADKMFCDYRAGLLGSIPTIFGLQAGEVVETECQLRGDGRCLYRVAWDPNPSRDPVEEISFLRHQVAALADRFESLEDLASDLAKVGEIDDVLHAITSRASVAVRAPQYLLAVRLPGDELPRVHTIGVP